MTGHRVFIIDDHEDIRMVLSALLRVSGRYQVTAEAANGAEAVDMADGVEADVVILDLSMPVMDGLQALPRLRAALPGAKIVVLSGFGTDRTVHAAMNAGADSFLTKGADLPRALVPLLDSLVAPGAPSEGGIGSTALVDEVIIDLSQPTGPSPGAWPR